MVYYKRKDIGFTLHIGKVSTQISLFAPTFLKEKIYSTKKTNCYCDSWFNLVALFLRIQISIKFRTRTNGSSCRDVHFVTNGGRGGENVPSSYQVFPNIPLGVFHSSQAMYFILSILSGKTKEWDFKTSTWEEPTGRREKWE